MFNKIKEKAALYLSKINFLQKYFKKPDEKMNYRTRAIIAVVIAVAFLTIGSGIGIYAKKARGGLIDFWARVIPYPAAVVRWKIITYADFSKDLAALKHFYAREATSSGLPTPEEQVLEKAVVDRLVKNAVILNLAREKKLAVSAEEIDEQFEKTVSQIGTREDAARLLQDLYGWDKKTFNERILYYYLLEEKLAGAYGGASGLDEAISAETKNLKEIRFLGK